MKKWFLVLTLLMAFCLPVMAEQPDYMLSQEFSGNTLVKSSSARVNSVTLSYVGATAGDYIQLIDGTTSTGTVRWKCVASASSGTCPSQLTVAMYFGTAVLYTEQKSSGAIFKTYIQYF